MSIGEKAGVAFTKADEENLRGAAKKYVAARKEGNLKIGTLNEKAKKIKNYLEKIIKEIDPNTLEGRYLAEFFVNRSFIDSIKEKMNEFPLPAKAGRAMDEDLRHFVVVCYDCWHAAGGNGEPSIRKFNGVEGPVFQLVKVLLQELKYPCPHEDTIHDACVNAANPSSQLSDAEIVGFIPPKNPI